MNAPNAFSHDKSTTDRAAYEPSMEEILASIRRIIADDQAPIPSRPAAEPGIEAPAPVVPSIALDNVLHAGSAEPSGLDGWTEVPAALPPQPAPTAVAPEPAPVLRSAFDFVPGREFRPRPPAPERPTFTREPPPRPVAEPPRPVAEPSRAVADPPIERREHPRRYAPGPRPAPLTPAVHEEVPLVSPATDAMVAHAFNTLVASRFLQSNDVMSEMVREMLKPMLKAWLDDNLPIMVERLVRAEIERVARGR
jgi:uncharacterized protein